MLEKCILLIHILITDSNNNIYYYSIIITCDSIYAIARLCDSEVSVCPSVCHTPVLCLAE